jgi:hypothetical protein
MAPIYRDLPAYIHEVAPRAIVINNNNTSLDIDDVDFGTTEFLAGEPTPAYCRPNALRRMEPRFKVSIPGADFNEDIPTCNEWWHQGGELSAVARQYADDPNFLLRQMLSSLGQRGQWNFALGIGPLVDGTMPAPFRAGLARAAEFMQWGAEAVRNTTGGEGGILTPGWFTAPWQNEGFCSVTRSLAQPEIYYVSVTTAPQTDAALFHTRGAAPRRITDLRSGTEVPFTMLAGAYLTGIDWRDVEECGVKVFRFDF